MFPVGSLTIPRAKRQRIQLGWDYDKRETIPVVNILAVIAPQERHERFPGPAGSTGFGETLFGFESLLAVLQPCLSAQCIEDRTSWEQNMSYLLVGHANRVLAEPVNQPFFTDRVDNQPEPNVENTIVDALSFGFTTRADVPQSARQESPGSDQLWHTIGRPVD